MRNSDRHDDLPAAETPEDVAVLYSWANLHGAKYRDFSASRREYRAQLRRRAAEQVRDIELQAKDEAELAAEEAAAQAEAHAREAEHAVQQRDDAEAEVARVEALWRAEEAARIATAERIEAARRAEAAAAAEAAARREEREIVEAHASAQRQSARYAESERHRRELETVAPHSSIPGQISDPYTPLPQQAALFSNPSSGPAPLPEIYLQPVRPASSRRDPQPAPAAQRATQAAFDDREDDVPMSDWKRAPEFSDDDPPPPPPPLFHPRGYRPDDASGVRRIVRSPEFEDPISYPEPTSSRRTVSSPPPSSMVSRSDRGRPPSARLGATRPGRPEPVPGPQSNYRPEPSDGSEYEASPRPVLPPLVARSGDRDPAATRPGKYASQSTSHTRSANSSGMRPEFRPDYHEDRNRPATPIAHGVVSPFSQQPLSSARAMQKPESYDPRSREPEAYVPPSRSRQPEAYTPVAPVREARPTAAEPYSHGTHSHGTHSRAHTADLNTAPQAPSAAVPAWIYDSADAARNYDRTTGRAEPEHGDTLQQSRERVASRWYALKGVFEQSGTTLPETQLARNKETRTPMLAVFSLAGGVGKTSLVATLGRSLSSLGEKVLLTDTTAHGLLPFYFGASELRQGTVRTFSPPSGSTDAPIYLVSYDADCRRNEEAAEEALAEEITTSGRATHRVLLDLSAASAWVVRRLARSNPIILVPVSPDMNSVISLQAVEKLFADVHTAEGRPPQINYLLNQFDASLPLHLDVREVLRRQLGERLLPFAIRRAPVISEALAEGMTVVDYAPEAPVVEDYLHVANWLRAQAAPATAGFRNVRWSEG